MSEYVQVSEEEMRERRVATKRNSEAITPDCIEFECDSFFKWKEEDRWDATGQFMIPGRMRKTVRVGLQFLTWANLRCRFSITDEASSAPPVAYRNLQHAELPGLHLGLTPFDVANPDAQRFGWIYDPLWLPEHWRKMELWEAEMVRFYFPEGGRISTIPMLGRPWPTQKIPLDFEQALVWEHALAHLHESASDTEQSLRPIRNVHLLRKRKWLRESGLVPYTGTDPRAALYHGASHWYAEIQHDKYLTNDERAKLAAMLQAGVA